jgi:hypothetical protein
MWKVGTRRILGVLDAYGEAEGDLQAPLYIMRKFTNTTIRIYGNYVVCPLTQERPGAMQMVCVESGSRLLAKSN